MQPEPLSPPNPLDDRSAALGQPATASAPSRPQRFSAPFIRKLGTARQIQVLGLVLLTLLAGIVLLMVLDRRQSSYAGTYLAIANEMQVLTQRIASAAQQAAQGTPAGSTQLAQTEERFERALEALAVGGLYRGIGLPPSSGEAKSQLSSLTASWQETKQLIAQILANKAGKTERAADVTVAAQGHVAVQTATQALLDRSEKLLESTQRVAHSYQNEAQAQSGMILGALALSGCALACLLLIGRIVVDDAEQRAFESQQYAAINGQANQKTQEAILRLLDEMGNLAQGDLTVRANISDEVTGAIADSVNFAVDELRRLVTGINDAATHVALASSQAQRITGELLDAAQRQASEITQTNAAVAGMASSITQVSEHAARSAHVAEQSLAAASQGAGAVENAIQGMDSIREQIQETAKRIKRLGESSQEIGEIVGLINDITEQTNVLALNAAIQASSAGSAGRGFTLVAEEVQRLAERSAAATRQIGVIVKTIQSDTQDVISAMERSTQSVVEQAGLADNAGQALTRIDTVSRELASLISGISAATRQQTDTAARVRQTMQEILNITELTTEGTRRTAESTAQLATMAASLKQSVANFKLT